MGKQIFISATLLIINYSLLIQTAVAQIIPNTFGYPMDTPLYLSAPFGSLRDNHFHSGMDIRTYEKTGLPVYAIEDGYVVRIKYSSTGYGKAIYINHPNGFTSVYGHLENANGAIADYIKKYQYEIKDFDFDHFPGKDRLKVRKGDTIAWSGNSGTSTGPHLHFEIRETRTEEIMNPQLFGIFGVDTLPPAIKNLLFYNLNFNRPVLMKTLAVPQTDSVLKDTVVLNFNKLGIAVEAIDKLVDAKKEYSIYGLELSVDNRPMYRFRLDRFAFDETRCVNVHIDYAEYKDKSIRYQKLFVDDGNVINLYSYLRNKGKYLFADNKPHLFKLSARDFAGNQASINFWAKWDGTTFKDTAQKNFVKTLYPNRENFYIAKNFQLTTHKKSLYDTLELIYTTQPKEKGMLSDIHQVHEPSVPLHKGVLIAIKIDTINPKLQSKLSLGTYTKNNNIVHAGGVYESGSVRYMTTNFGTYFVIADTVSPVARLDNVKGSNISDTTSLRIKISDNLSGISSYKGTINGKWVLFEYDAKNGMLEYFFDKETPKGKFELELNVWDRKENQTTLKQTLNRP